MKKLVLILNLLIAALLITGAASFAVGQKKNRKNDSSKNKEAAATATPTPTPEPTPESEPQPGKKNNRDKKDENTQTAPPDNAEKKNDADAVVYGYEFKQPQFVISHIIIEHDANGKGKVTFEKKDAGEPITDPVEISQEAWARIKSLWETLNFLDSTTNYQSDKQYPHLGTMRLKMKRGTKQRTAEFNWSDDKKASELANEYRRIADQAIFVFEINLSREISPLDAPKIMEGFDSLLKRNGYSDPKQLLPLLRDVSIDERLPLIARNHAKRLIQQIEKSK